MECTAQLHDPDNTERAVTMICRAPSKEAALEWAEVSAENMSMVVADFYEKADPEPECHCEDGTGACYVCLDRAEAMHGCKVKDRHGRVWIVDHHDEHDGYATVSGSIDPEHPEKGGYWAPLFDFEGNGGEVLARPEGRS